jgi:hypothetical protein
MNRMELSELMRSASETGDRVQTGGMGRYGSMAASLLANRRDSTKQILKALRVEL